MPEFLTTSGCSHHIEQIILTAKTQVHLLCPYLKLSKTLFERLVDANRRGVKVRIVYGKTELNPTEKQKLYSLENVELYFFENLHAKCYFNKDNMVITSMNIYEFSEKNNREMGILLSAESDAITFMKAYNEAVSIVKNAVRQHTVKIEIREGIGYCIRCLKELKTNPLKPLCPNCYKQWSKYGNKLYAEKYCHRCGSETQSSLENPICKSCVNA
jgi:phosphatidylserine/phosphatidylglycerophosphate/cardiolipin synthase-like enzyme